MSKKSIDSRSELLLGESFNKLKNKKIAVCGIGGVGSIIPLSMVRSGISNFVLVDFDKVDITNLNRQICYDTLDIDKYKVDAMMDKMQLIRNNIDVVAYKSKICKTFDFSIFDNCDYVFDCIDDLEAKVQLIKYCVDKKIKIISSLGMGNRLDSCCVKITKLNKTTGDPLARKLRYLLKNEGVDLKEILVSFSIESPIIKGKVIASMVFVPNASGLAMASYATRDLLNK